MSDLSNEWNSCVKYGKGVWLLPKPEEHGQQNWQPLKIIYSQDKRIFQWKADFLKEWNLLNKLDNSGKEHFLRQLFRIPLEEEANMPRITQIAYNLGQLEGSNALNFIEEKIPGTIDNFKKYQLDKISTYIDYYN